MAREKIPYYKEKMEIVQVKKTNPKKAIRLCAQLRKKAKEDGDEQQVAVADYYAADSSCACEEYAKCIELASRCISPLQKYKRFDILADVYNLRGVSYTVMGDNQKALTDFLLAISYSKKKKEKLVMENNIGVLYFDFENYAEAYKYFERVYSSTIKYYNLETGEVSKNCPSISIMVTLINMADVLAQLERYDEALVYLDRIDQYIAVFKDRAVSVKENQILYKICHAKIAFGQQDLKEALRYSWEIIDLLNNQKLDADSSHDAQRLIPYLTKYGFLKEAKILLDNIYENANRFNTTAHWVEYYTCAIDYYKAEQNIAKLIESYDQYFYYAKEKEVENNKKFVRDIETKISLEKIRTKQKESEEKARYLKLLSETDGLTGVLNRYSMNKMCDDLFKRAQVEGKYMGLMLFDVDCFKEYNDTYGHVAGDECLKAVSAVLNEFSDAHHFVARYGGDEFLLMAFDQTNEDMEQVANEIKDKIHALKMEHKNSKNEEKIVSLTIGVTNHIPKSDETVLDEIQMTDEALYTAKKIKRGTISFDFS